MGKKSMRRALAILLAAALMLVSSFSVVFAATSPTSGNTAKDGTKQGPVGEYKMSKKGTCTLINVIKKNTKTKTIFAYIKKGGVKYKTVGIAKNAFKGCKKLRTIKVKATKPLTVKKGAFKGLNTKKITVKVTKKMSKKNFNKFKKALKKAGFKGKIKRVKL